MFLFFDHAETSALDVETSVFVAAKSAIARRSFDTTISALNAETLALGVAISRGVTGDIGVEFSAIWEIAVLV